MSKNAQLRNVKHDKKTLPQAQIVHSHVLQVVAADCDEAFQAFFRRIKNDETPGYPRFKGWKRFHSFGFRMAGRRLKVSGVGRIAVRWHRAIAGFVPCQIKTLRITHKAGRWYACQSQPSCQKLNKWLAWMSGYPHGSRPAQVRRFKTPTPTGRAKRNCVFCNVHWPGRNGVARTSAKPCCSNF